MKAIYHHPDSAAALLQSILDFCGDFEADDLVSEINTDVAGIGAKTSTNKIDALKSSSITGLMSDLRDFPDIAIVSAKIELRDSRHSTVRAMLQIAATQFPSLYEVRVIQANNRESARMAHQLSHKHFPRTTPTPPATGAEHSQYDQLLAAKTEVNADLQKTLTKFSDLLASAAAKHSDSVTTALEQITEQARSQEADLFARINAERKKLQEEIEAFNADKAQFDARESTVVRRETMNQLRDTIANTTSIKVSLATLSKRLFIHAICLLILGGSSYLVFVFSERVLLAESFDWRLLAPVSAGLLSIAVTLVWYLKWNDSWFREHAKHEMQLSRSQTDALRAHWLAELMFEWDKEKSGRPFPEELIRTFSQGLFYDKSIPEVRHAYDDIATFASSIKRLKLGKDIVIAERDTKAK
jgi:hypothetical protein